MQLHTRSGFHKSTLETETVRKPGVHQGLMLPLHQLLAGFPAKPSVLLSGGLHAPQLLWQALQRNEEMVFLMEEVSQLKEAGCPKHNTMPQRESCCISLPCLYPTILSRGSLFPSSWSSLIREEHSQIVWGCYHSYTCTALEIMLIVSSNCNSLQKCQRAQRHASGIASSQESYTGCLLYTQGASTHTCWMNHCSSSLGY